jgi:hypothetical protein
MRDTRKVHHLQLRRDENGVLDWRVVCDQLSISELRTSGKLEEVTCKNCRKISEAKLEKIRTKIMPRVMKIPWVKEAIKDGVFDVDKS